jgi:hypothetical protein
VSLRRYPYTTGLQAYLVAFTAVLDAAREQLDPVEHHWLLDLLITRIANEAAQDLEDAA